MQGGEDAYDSHSEEQALHSPMRPWSSSGRNMMYLQEGIEGGSMENFMPQENLQESLQHSSYEIPIGKTWPVQELGLRRDASMRIDEDIKSLFRYISCFKPREIEMGAVLRPFIPDYIPAVGAVDEFIKVPRPDGIPDYLGLKVVDESGPIQSDPAVVALQLRASSMQSTHHLAEVATIEDPEKSPQKIDAWIDSMRDFHRSKPPSYVSYSKCMPDMKKLLLECPVEIDKALEEIELMNAEDIDLPEFVDICCSFVGIPVNTLSGVWDLTHFTLTIVKMPNFGKNNWRMQSIGSVITQKGKAVLGIAAQQIASGSRPNDLVTLAGT